MGFYKDSTAFQKGRKKDRWAFWRHVQGLSEAETRIEKVVKAKGLRAMDREELKKTRQKKRKKGLKVFLRLALLAFFLFAAVRFISQQPLLSEYDKKIGDLNDQIQQQEKDKAHYEELKALYETEEYQKQLARERLGLVEENEKVFIDVSGKQ